MEEKKRFKAVPVAFGYVDFPVALATPAVLDATQAAMAKNIFDEIGGLPGRRSRKGDPIVVGRILRPTAAPITSWQLRPAVTFLIAWWVDTRQL
jgi:hypothetical protein